MLAFDSNLMPIVGQQVTLTDQNVETVSPRINLLMEQADAKHCDLIAKNQDNGFLYIGDGQFISSKKNTAIINSADLQSSVNSPSGEITFSCVPYGSGYRVGIDRDEDGTLDNDESLAGDIDNDGDIDKLDLSILLSSKNTPVTDSNDPKDLDGNGMINALDARRLVLLCTRPRCAVN